MTSAQTLRALLVGYGDMGKSCHFPVLSESPEVDLVGVVRASQQETAPGVPVFQSLAEALKQVQPDLAIISTPHRLHYQQARDCLEHGCHLLVEKPLTLRYADAQDLVDLAERKERLLVVGLQRRYEGLAATFRQLVDEGKLGEIRLVHGLFGHRFSEADRGGWRADPDLAGAGIVDDSALHLLDLLLYFAGGHAEALEARVLSSGRETAAHSFSCFFDTTNGAAVSACGTYLSPVNSVQEEISIWGSEGALFGRRFCRSWNTDPPQVFYKSSDGRHQQEFDLSELPRGRALPLQALLGVLTGKAPRTALLTEARETLEVHRVVELIRQRFQASAD